MKKRLLACVLAVSMVFTLVACGDKAGDTTTPPQNQDSFADEFGEDIVQDTTDTSVEEKPGAEVNGETVGAIIKADFQRIVAENEGMSAEDIAAKLCENEALTIGPISMPIEPGLLNGLGNAEITGFKEGALFAPMIGAIPFIGYVFVMEEGADVDAFMNTLKENGDLRWNICTTADEMVIDRADNTVLFVMCPLTFEE